MDGKHIIVPTVVQPRNYMERATSLETYEKKLQRSSPDAYNVRLPSRQENLRLDLTRKELSSPARATQNLDLYRTATRTPPLAAPLDRTALATQYRTRDFYTAAGTRASAPCNVPETSAVVNVNALRFEKKHRYGDGILAADGGAQYSREVCISNFVEERRDKDYTPLFVPKDLRTRPLNSTEYMERFRPASSEYKEQLMTQYNDTSRFQGLSPPVPATAAATGVVVDTNMTNTLCSLKATGGSSGALPAITGKSDYLGYTRDGFGKTPWQDHTTPAKQGAWWVGTAPAVQDTVTHTAHCLPAGELEFTRKCATEDPRQQILMRNGPLIQESERVHKVCEALLQSQKHTTAWKTTHKEDFKDYSRAVRCSS